MIGAGLAGPRRIKAGGARDHLLGAHAVSGFGDSFKAGGKVVKNVTGYDLCKLLAGSWGTLAVMTEVTLKVMPRPESERTLVLRGLDDIAANRAMTAALGSPFDVSGAAHLPNPALRAAADGLAGLGSPQQAVTLLRLEGITASVAHRAAALGKAAGAIRNRGDARRCGLGGDLGFGSRCSAVRGQWHVGRLAGLADRLSASLGRCARPAAFARYRRRRDLRLGWRADLAALPPKPDAQASLVRQRVDAAGGHATLLRAPEEVRRNVDVFHPQQAGLAALGERVRHSFDPKRILNRGRMQAGLCDMKTEFSLAQLADPDIAEADKILRACVHCGFCTATCPTYVLLGDELDSPRGRIYLIKEMLEKDRPPTPEVVKHIDRCLSCLACMTTCPSGVNYMHLVDQARVRIEKEYHQAACRAGACVRSWPGCCRGPTCFASA